MKNAAIIVENISKKFQIGSKQSSYPTMRDMLTNACVNPLRKIQTFFSGKPYTFAGQTETLWALQDISFEVQHGEVLGIVGSNGAGKSTLLKILSKITRPTKGRAILNGRLGSLLEVGTGFHPDLTGRENIYLNGAILGMTKSDIVRQFDEIIAFAEIDKFLDTPVKFYSSGMYIRLAFAVAAHLEPDILIVDEVLAVGDIRFQKKCLGKMKDIAKSGRTVLFVSHNLPAVRSFCSRAILLEQGRLIASGETDAILKQYLHSSLTYEGCRTWEENSAPRNESFRIHSIRLTNQQGTPLQSVLLSQDLFVEIDYELFKEGSQVGFSLLLYDIEGQCIFSSLNNLEQEFYGKPLSKGTYKTRCCIYGNLLNEGRHYITLLGFGANRSDFITLERILSFDATDDGILRGDFHGNFSGTIRPKLEWQSNLV